MEVVYDQTQPVVAQTQPDGAQTQPVIVLTYCLTVVMGIFSEVV